MVGVNHSSLTPIDTAQDENAQADSVHGDSRGALQPVPDEKNLLGPASSSCCGGGACSV